ncbi:MAG: hypothetical protein KKB34_04855 [Bacteroidetes bacterium]|nr:hypothetical protein [Bacteroidota bacterium]
MTDWHPGKGDYIKRYAMADSRRRKNVELKNRIITYGLIISITVILMFAYVAIFE